MAAIDKIPVHELSAPKLRPTTAPEMVDYMLMQAVKMRASDIHLGNTQAIAGTGPQYVLRFRVHGKLQNVKFDFFATHQREIIARLKVLAGISTVENAATADGQLHMNTPEGLMVLRFSVIATPDGEEIVGRIQRATKVPPIQQLGMTTEMLAHVNHLIQQKSGMIVINGPAGSGKTTTIYSLLSTLGSPERKILTAEDPIELRLPHVSHTSVTKNNSFAELARAFMRQDADVIFIGEVRDNESAEVAVQLAQTGHLVLTTLHTRDSLGVIPRLEAFGVHPNFIASSLIGSLAQRLIPMLCQHCRVEQQPDEATWNQLQKILQARGGTKVFKAGPGCPQCVSGHAGRVPVFELLTVTPQISELINRGAPRKELVDLARTQGMLSLSQEIMIRVYSGYISLESARGYLI